MYKDDYRAALGKLAPGSAWKEDTLRKMRAIEEERGAPPPDAPWEEKRAVPFLTKLRRAALPVAAVLAIAIVPLTTLRGCGSADGSSMMPQQKDTAAAPFTLSNGAPARAGDGEESSSVASASTRSTQEIADGPSAPAQSAEGNGDVGCAIIRGPVTHSDLEVTLPADGSTQFPFTHLVEGMGGMGGFIVKTPDAAELAGSNPTLDLPAEDMPTALPVYRTMTDSGEMYDVLANTASILGETVVEEREGFDAETIPQDALDAGVPWRVPHAFVDTENWLSLSFKHYDVHYYSYANAASDAEDDALMEAPAGLAGEELLRYYYDNYGAKLQPLENPALETTGNYSYYKDYSSDSFWYEAGEPDDTLETRLYNYTFKQIKLAVKQEDNTLFVVDYTVPPEEIGVGSLRTLDEAKQVLFDGGAWIGGDEPGGYDGEAVNILHWELAYHTSDLSEIVQPVYVFLIDTPDGSVPPFDDGEIEDYKYVTYAYVPALQEEYVVETPYRWK